MNISDQTRIVSVAQMQWLEREADAAGQSYAAMMEQAGAALAQAVLGRLPPGADRSVLVLAGPGNNGGDGLVCARHLCDAGLRVRVYLWKRRTDPADDDEGHFAQLTERNVSSQRADEDVDGVQLHAWLDEAAVVVDALLGTGASRRAEGTLARILRQLADERDRRRTGELPSGEKLPGGVGTESSLPPTGEGLTVVACDFPSGLHGDSGAVDPATVPADVTVTFGCAKSGHFHFPGADILGELMVADIGIPGGLAEEIRSFFLTPEQVAEFLPARSRNSHKGAFGKGMAVVGSVNYPGAAFLSCAAMGRVGAGLVTGAIPQPVWVPVSSRLAEPTWILLSHDVGVVNEDAVATIGPRLGAYDALLIGCGLGQESATRDFLERLLRRNRRRRPSALTAGFAAPDGPTNGDGQPVSGEDMVPSGAGEAEEGEGGGRDGKSSSPFGRIRRRDRLPAEVPPLPPTVIDADGLNILAQLDNWPSLLPADCVLTPHPAEMARLCGMASVQDVIEDRWGLARARASAWQAVVLLKGPYTVIASPGGELAVLPVATAALATAGTGDVLAGAITGLLAQGLSPFHAACLGAWLHGRAGELCERQIGRAGAVAGDLLHLLPAAMEELRR